MARPEHHGTKNQERVTPPHFASAVRRGPPGRQHRERDVEVVCDCSRGDLLAPSGGLSIIEKMPSTFISCAFSKCAHAAESMPPLRRTMAVDGDIVSCFQDLAKCMKNVATLQAELF